MKTLSLIHLGIGKVGSEVVKQITSQRTEIKKTFGVDLVYQGKFTAENTQEEIAKVINTVALPFVLIDTTASEQTIQLIKQALQRGGFVVLANKKPLSGEQKEFDVLNKIGGKRLLYECTVGAGLPVIQAVKTLKETGDEIIEIQGCFSGTLGYLFSQMDKGIPFSMAVLDAKMKGFTEPDPRDDLSGKDVARKALILARLLGQRISFDEINLKGLYPGSMSNLSRDEFLKNVSELDSLYKMKQEKAQKENKVLRFVAKVTRKGCIVGLQSIDKTSDIGGLSGPDNLVVIKTKRYFDNPLVIKGPGAGIEVTAAGVFADILTAAKMI